jgi:exopolysaccharide biosynthesis polyprenyl glycosylphosphotransferase
VALPPGRRLRTTRTARGAHAPAAARIRGRGWLMRRVLLVADIVGLVAAFAAAEALVSRRGDLSLGAEIVLFASLIPVWIVGATLFGLYDRDEDRNDHLTTDDLTRVFLLATVGVALLAPLTLVMGIKLPDPDKLVVFWAFLVLCPTIARGIGRALARHHPAYRKKALIVGAGEVGQLVARKLLQHREYRVDVLGFLEAERRILRPELRELSILGKPDDLVRLVRELEVDRVIFAFSEIPDRRLVDAVRSLRDAHVDVDLVPRLFETIGPKIEVHAVEGVPLIALPTVSIPHSLRLIKRLGDIAGASLVLALTAPLFAVVSLLIKLDSPGPVFFRQLRLGKDMRPFVLLKFRTMEVDTEDAPHRAYIAATMSSSAMVGDNGLYKLDRRSEVTRVGRWLRRTSLDELPQLLNVLRGDMSLVGPRPCLPYEVDHFEPHHFDRFLVPAGLTGLWQVSARAHSTFGEALELDVLYAHSWSLSLDLSLLSRTPVQLLRGLSGTT